MPRPISQLDRPKLVALLTAIAMAKADLSHQASLFGVDPEALWNLPKAEQAVERALASLDWAVDEDHLAQQDFRRAAMQRLAVQVRQEQEADDYFAGQADEDYARTHGMRVQHAEVE